jgi:hypothetical protein
MTEKDSSGKFYSKMNEKKSCWNLKYNSPLQKLAPKHIGPYYKAGVLFSNTHYHLMEHLMEHNGDKYIGWGFPICIYPIEQIIVTYLLHLTHATFSPGLPDEFNGIGKHWRT